MRTVIAELRRRGVDLASVDALEVFGRAGDWHTQDYAGEVRTLEVWELDSQYEVALRKNLPGASVRIGDSFGMAARSNRRYGLVVCDNEQGIFDGHCEHFDFLPLLPRVLADGVFVLNVNRRPYGLAEQPEWRRRRRVFYGRKDTERLGDGWISNFYRKRLADIGLVLEWDFTVPRDAFISYYVAKVTTA
jgi:hypothetical protein